MNKRVPFGYTGKVLIVDLTRKVWHIESTFDHLSFVGGRGINQEILFNLVNTDTEPLSPEAVIILGAGPLVGTLVPGASRLSVDYKNVITGGIGSGNCGGHFAPELKFAGFDHVVICGRASTPTYLLIHDMDVVFRDASEIWGCDTWETENRIKRAERDWRIKTLSIGVAGEKLAKIACIICDRGRAAAYGGSGAVMGSKNLKAIAVRGTQPLRVAHPDRLIQEVEKYRREVVDQSRLVKLRRRGGTLLPYTITGEKASHATRNLSDEFWPDEAIASVSREKLDRYLVRRQSCFNCPEYCSSIYSIGNLRCEGFQANTFRAFASNIDNRSPEVALEANALVNLYGLDLDHTSAAIAWAMECYEKRLLSKSDTGGLELTWGNGPAALQLIHDIANRRALGDYLADGVYEASQKIGSGTENLTNLVKKNSIMESSMRSHRGWALGVITSTKGGGHLRGAPGVESQSVPPDVCEELFGFPAIPAPTSYEKKAELVIWQEKYKGVVDMMGLCAISTVWLDYQLFRPDAIHKFYSLVTGRSIGTADLMHAGLRLHNLERSFNLLHAGFDRKADIPPARLFEIPISRGKYAGETIEIDKWNSMLDSYYSLHNWDIKTGRPLRKTLLDLDLSMVIQEMEKKGVLPGLNKGKHTGRRSIP